MSLDSVLSIMQTPEAGRRIIYGAVIIGMLLGKILIDEVVATDLRRIRGPHPGYMPVRR